MKKLFAFIVSMLSRIFSVKNSTHKNKFDAMPAAQIRTSDAKFMAIRPNTLTWGAIDMRGKQVTFELPMFIKTPIQKTGKAMWLQENWSRLDGDYDGNDFEDWIRRDRLWKKHN